MKKIAILCVFMTIALCAWGQDYLSRGRTYYANGNYSGAIEQFEAQLAFLDSKSVSKNADEYISVEKLLAKARTCLPLLRKAKTAFTEAEKAGTEEAYNAAIEAYNKILKQNSSDRNAKAMKTKCEKAIISIAYEKEALAAWASVDLGEISSIESLIPNKSLLRNNKLLELRIISHGDMLQQKKIIKNTWLIIPTACMKKMRQST